MIKRLRTFFGTTEGKLKAVIILSGTLLILLILTVSGLKMTSTPQFCSSCHEMAPEYFTWQASAHNKVSCVSCHIEPGTANFVTHKIESLSQLYYHFTGTYITPIAIKDKIENTQCVQCHDMQTRVATPSGDLKFPHTKHLDQKLDCVECHSGVAHGNIERKGITALTDFDKWNLAVGAAYVSGPDSKAFTGLQMAQCVACHTSEKAPVTCETCHNRIVKPSSHNVTTWSSLHGKEADKDIKACDSCHSVTSRFKGNIPKEITTAGYARSNTFCNKCHDQKPSGHTEAWKKTHSYPAQDNPTQCFVCHNESRSQFEDKAPTALTCQSCHAQKHNLVKSNHPIAIPASGYGAQCGNCHNSAACEKCHAKARS